MFNHFEKKQRIFNSQSQNVKVNKEDHTLLKIIVIQISDVTIKIKAQKSQQKKDQQEQIKKFNSHIKQQSLDYFYEVEKEENVLLKTLFDKNQLKPFIVDFFRQKGYQLGKFIAKGGYGVVFDGKIYQNKIIKEVVFKIQISSDNNKSEEKEFLLMKGFEKNLNLIEVQSFQKIVLDNAIQNEISKRKTCLELHKLFYEAVALEENPEFVFSYVDKIRMILLQTDFFNEQSKPKDAKEYMLKSYDLCNQIYKKEHLYTANTLNMLGQFNLKYDGLDYSLKSIEMIDKILKGDCNYKAIYQNTLSWCNETVSIRNITKLCYKEGQLKESLSYYKKYFQMVENLKYEDDQVYMCLYNMAKCYFNLNLYQDSFENLQAFLKINLNNPEKIIKAHNIISVCKLRIQQRQSGLKSICKSITVDEQQIQQDICKQS
ncbi:hypothetical protein ABPG73_006116 [Tetrahymena malaccensis]